MAVQIYSKEFSAFRNRDGIVCEEDRVVREKVLKKTNEFLFKHDNIDVVNIVENWNGYRDHLSIVVYYKGYI